MMWRGGPAPSDDWTELTSDADGSELTEDEDYLAEEDLQSEEIAALGEDPNEHEGPGTGRDKEPCWKKEEAPGYDYLLTISITSDGLVVEPRWPLGRDPEAQAMAQRLTPIVEATVLNSFLLCLARSSRAFLSAGITQFSRTIPASVT